MKNIIDTEWAVPARMDIYVKLGKIIDLDSEIVTKKQIIDCILYNQYLLSSLLLFIQRDKR